MTDRPWVRPTARVVVLDLAGRVLLLGARLTDPAVPPGDVLFWYTPGGRVKPGEGVSAETFAPLRLASLLPELAAGPWTGPPRFVG